MSVRSSVTFFNQALCVWEDMMCMAQYHALQAKVPVYGAVAHWRDFRRYLLQYRYHDVFDRGRFVYRTAEGAQFGMPTALNLMIASWVSQGKRVYRLSEQMQSVFANISFGVLELKDIVIPLRAFAIQYAAPIARECDGLKTAMVVVSNYPRLLFDDPMLSEQTITVSMLPEVITEYVPLDRADVALLLKKAESGDRTVRKVYKRIKCAYDSQSDCIRRLCEGDGYILPTKHDMLVEEYLQHLTKQGIDPSDIVQLRIIYNLCVYLQTLASDATQTGVIHQEREIEVQNSVRPLCVSESDLCVVTGLGTIGTTVRSHARGTQEQRKAPIPHWRIAHKRRPKGQGANPSAEKTVSVPATLVHAELLTHVAGVVLGSTKKV
jgi:hypothetical protein